VDTDISTGTISWELIESQRHQIAEQGLSSPLSFHLTHAWGFSLSPLRLEPSRRLRSWLIYEEYL
jgi:hypothetical protein